MKVQKLCKYNNVRYIWKGSVPFQMYFALKMYSNVFKICISATNTQFRLSRLEISPKTFTKHKIHRLQLMEQPKLKIMAFLLLCYHLDSC